MIFIGTHVNVIDNSGAIHALCIHTYRLKKAKIGDKILVTLRRVKPARKVECSQMYKAIVIRSSTKLIYKGNHSVIGNMNCVILLKRNGDIMGTRFKGPIFYRLIDKKLSKALTLSENIY